MVPALHQAAPDFTLRDQAGKEHRLSDYQGNWVLLYFYPKDDTTGCTAEACGLRDSIKQYEEKRCIILGISADSIESHEAFAKKYSLPFPLLADIEKEVINAYGVWQEKISPDGTKRMGIVRTSFLIDPEGKIAKVYPNVQPELHSEEVLADVDVRSNELLAFGNWLQKNKSQ